MGSRITRAFYRQQRQAPVHGAAKGQMQTMASYFLAFISCLFFFLSGYLYRPYLQIANNASIPIILIALISIINKKQITLINLVFNVLLFILFIAGHISGIQIYLFKAILIICSVGLNSITSYQMMNKPVTQAVLIWIQYQCFSIGINLSLQVQKILVNKGNLMGKEQGLLVKILFSLISIMCVFLINFGKKLLRKQKQQIKQIPINQKIIQSILVISTIIVSLTVKHELQSNLVIKTSALILAFLTYILIIIFKHSSKLFIIILLLMSSLFLLNWAVESDQAMLTITATAKSFLFNIVTLDIMTRWIRNLHCGNVKPVISVSIYFIAFFIGFLSTYGKYLYNLSPQIFEIVGLASYLGLVGYGVLIGHQQYQTLA